MKNTWLPWLLVAICLGACVVMNQRAADVESTADMSFTLDPQQTLYLSVQNNADTSERKVALNAGPGDRIDITIRQGVPPEVLPFDQLMNNVIAPPVDGALDEPESSIRNLVHVPVVPTSLNFHWQNPLNQQLQKLRQHENLDEVIQGAQGDLQVFYALQNWVRKQWEPGSPSPYPDWNALQILDWIRSGKTSGFCGQYTQVLAQSLQARGYYCRYLWLKRHFAMEVYSPQLSQWLVLDPLYNLVYMQKGLPLNAYDLRKEVLEDGGMNVDFLNTLTGEFLVGAEKSAVAGAFEYVDYDLKSDQLTSPYGGLYFVDNYWRHSAVVLDKYLKSRDFKGRYPLFVNRADQLYFPMLQTEVVAAGLQRGFLHVRLRTYNPYPHPESPYLLSIDGGRNWQACQEAFRLPVERGKNLQILVKARNAFVAGPAASFSVHP